MEKILAKDSLSKWVATLAEADVYSPVFEDNQWNYEIIDDPEKVRLDHALAVHSAMATDMFRWQAPQDARQQARGCR